MSSKKKRPISKEKPSLVESVNSLPGPGFYLKYLSSTVLESFLESTNEAKPLLARARLDQKTAPDLKAAEVKQCLDLIEQTSKADYDASGDKWSRSKKRKEMLLPDMKYLIYYETEQAERKFYLAGFVSFMITYEDGHEVLYVYEIHFGQDFQGLGYGTDMMNVVESIGCEVGVEKVMLTVFKSNERAIKWYGKRGYVVDEYSPGPREFRNGTVKESAYLILSKGLKSSGEAQGSSEAVPDVNSEESVGMKNEPIQLEPGSEEARSPPTKRNRVR